LRRYDRRLRVFEAIALRGVVSGYELKNILGISQGHAQWWLKEHEGIREYGRERIRRGRVFYGLTMIGFLLALKSPKVRNNFSSVFEKFLSYQVNKTIDPKLRESTLQALKSKDVSDRFKELYLAISDALDQLTDIYSIDEEKVFDLATYLANLNEPEKMRQILRDLYPKVPLIQRVADAYRLYSSQLDKIVKGEIE